MPLRSRFTSSRPGSVIRSHSTTRRSTAIGGSRIKSRTWTSKRRMPSTFGQWLWSTVSAARQDHRSSHWTAGNVCPSSKVAQLGSTTCRTAGQSSRRVP
ncbi:hypothetical protein B0H12DRAFT_1109829 [Mycena haematopus]|nr:hypothetical protein B0H12DRAFT_1109829 [Mycena haematopus]